ncbi:Plasmodium exported protein, unknown function [Plasmodium berghei]|uniref:Uncharacterized protein n=5 Tax=Plasmodium berghei TaxID=5821 RepID=A0A509ACN3_PLABA|nr:Plasmodium exported protein, unknown function [Plasmodium berghei ANKA]CXH97260.1 Plasmodium exported protein, unknown function [Plasmodium berghei]SCL91257.1 Plasmodium exported protein, unknown function [Plasmodium berghei]SCM15457.1 Plasmodium exported protein, unknown function [Plasmodium berghei]VUC54199.1 Plasmodium exported protein, unknown function [Plasmodium berghei ANKA]|eukprot:XP_034420043.1 Plasmodium exported protein, unknown function [Plasmodium berghei ANKA]
MEKSNNNLLVRSYISDYNKNSKFIEYDEKNNIHKKNDGHMIAELYQKNKTNIFSFLIKIFIVIQIIWISQFSSRNDVFGEKGISNYENWEHFKNNEIIRNHRILMENLLKSPSGPKYEILEKNVMDQIDHIYKTQSKSFWSKIMGFIKKMDLLFEREVIRILEYIEKEKEKPIKDGIKFFKSLKVFFNGLKLFSAPIAAAANTLLIYYFKPQIISLTIGIGLNILPIATVAYVIYKIYKVNSEIQKSKFKKKFSNKFK